VDASIVIPTHNKKQELRRCVEAVLAQQFHGEFEVLVCDDGSSDGAAEMIEEWACRDARLRYFRQPKRGPAAARNLGIRHARAPLIAMTDDDAIPQPGWLERLCAALRDPSILGAEGFVASGRPLGPGEAAPSNQTGGVYLTCNAIYRREALALVGGFDERFPFAAFEDCDLAAKIRRHGQIVWVPDAVVLHPPRRATAKNMLQRLRHWPWVMVMGRRYGYLGWPRFPTRHPRARVIWNALVKLPAGRLLAAVRALPSHPAQAFRGILLSLAEPFAALVIAIPTLLRFDLDSAALHMDYLHLSGQNQKAAGRDAPPAPFPKVGLVIVHYKQPELLRQCIQSFEGAAYPNLHRIVVESAANEADLRSLRRDLPGVEWLAAAENLGYTGGNNLGIAKALEEGCKFILLANADTECIAPDFISRLVRFMDLNPRVALAGPRVYLRRRGEVQNTVLRYPSLLGNIVDWFGFRLFPRRYQRSRDAPLAAKMLNGVCVMLRAEAVRQVGMFDPRFFMYIEDADLGFRLRRAGWQVAYVPVDSLVHHQRRTGYELESEVSLLLRRNSVYFLRKHRRPVQAWGLAAANVVMALVRALTSTSAGAFRRRLAFVRSLCRELRFVLAIPARELQRRLPAP
jgi:GT2 family glycosyltransferase